MKRIIAIGLAFALTGCSSMTPTTRWLEAGHSALITADTLQTMQGQNAPDCYREVGSFGLIGSHPSDAQLTAYGTAHIAVHSLVSGWLDRKIANDDDDGWRWVRAGWHVLTFGLEIKTVVDNHHEGLGLNPNVIPQRCLDARAEIH